MVVFPLFSIVFWGVYLHKHSVANHLENAAVGSDPFLQRSASSSKCRDVSHLARDIQRVGLEDCECRRVHVMLAK